MAILFSDYHKLDKKKLEEQGVFNPIIGIDTNLFLDPYLLKKTTIKEFKNSRDKIKKYYEDIIHLLVAHITNEQRGNRAWREALKRLRFKETQGISIGYGVHGSDGNAIGFSLAKRLLDTAIEIVEMGIKDPEIFELIGLFEEDFGADRLSDMTIAIIREDILNYTQNLTEKLKIQNTLTIKYQDKSYTLPRHPYRNGPLLLLPKELLRDLPVALTWDGIDHVVSTNRELRERLNRLIGETWKNKIKKRQLRDLMLEDKNNIKSLIEFYKLNKADHYDFENDPKGEFIYYELGNRFAYNNPLALKITKYNIDGLKAIVEQIIEQFKRNIEFNGLNGHLYVKEGFRYKPRHERFAQRLFYAVADSYCNANNLDINREPNAGNGPVDFKFSKGYHARVLVEIKLSSSKRLLQGLQKQLPAYQESESTTDSFYVVIKTTRSDKQIKRLLKFRDQELKNNKKIPKIIIIDGWIKESASKR
jgi:hypothetical protein